MTASRLPYTLRVKELCGLLGVTREELSGSALGLSPSLAMGVPPPLVRSHLERRGHRYEPGVLAFMNLKGGVGKTTSAVTIASRAAQLGYRTCVIDLDAQASATLTLDAGLPEGSTVFHDVWAAPEETVAAALRPIQEGFALLPSSLENSLLDVSLNNPRAQKSAVRRACDAIQALGYELVLVDCPPSLGAASISACCAADVIVVPAASDAFSLRGIALTWQEAHEIRRTFGLPAPRIRILRTMVDGRLKLSAQVLEKLDGQYGDALLAAHVRTSSAFSLALERRQTVLAAGKVTPPGSDYDRITRELLGIGEAAEGES